MFNFFPHNIVFDCFLEIEESGCIGQDLLKIMEIWRSLDDGNRTEAVIKVGEEVGNSVVVNDFSKEDILV